MPGLDRTGPQGQGPRTGRQMGKCTSKKRSTEENELTDDTTFRRGRGLGLGRKSGKGLGLGNRFGRKGE